MLFRKLLDTGLRYPHPVFPPQAEILVVKERIDLECHVRLKIVSGSGFHPRLFHLHHADPVAGPVQHVLLETLLFDPCLIIRDDLSRWLSTLDQLHGLPVRVQAKLHQSLFPGRQRANRNGQAHAGRIPAYGIRPVNPSSAIEVPA